MLYYYSKYLNIYFIFYIHILTYLFSDNFMYLLINVIEYSPSTGHDKKKIIILAV